jgi:hypothetical protein
MIAVAVTIVAHTAPVIAQDYGTGSRNVRQIANIPLGMMVRADAAAYLVDLRLDQRPDRPFLYVAEQSGWAVVNLSNPNAPVVAAVVPDDYAPDRGSGISSIDYLQVGNLDLVVVGKADGLSVFDAGGLTEGERPELLANIAGSFGSLFAYRHSTGRALLIASSGGHASVYDAVDLVSGTATLLAQIPTPELPDSTSGYTSVYAAYHGDTDTDRFYGAGAGGYHVYDITTMGSATYVASANPAAVRRGLSLSPSADGRYLATSAAYRTAPVRIFDLKPAFSGKFQTTRTSMGAWADDWNGFYLDLETRWPYVFVAAAEKGLHVFNTRDVTDPYSVGNFSTSRRSDATVNDRPDQVGGAVRVDVRNHDGLIAVGDQQTGVWFLKLDGFSGWDGRGWGYPNISSAQDWINGPDGSSTFD